jgi:hypothetical protein
VFWGPAGIAPAPAPRRCWRAGSGRGS